MWDLNLSLSSPWCNTFLSKQPAGVWLEPNISSCVHKWIFLCCSCIQGYNKTMFLNRANYTAGRSCGVTCHSASVVTVWPIKMTNSAEFLIWTILVLLTVHCDSIMIPLKTVYSRVAILETLPCDHECTIAHALWWILTSPCYTMGHLWRHAIFTIKATYTTIIRGSCFCNWFTRRTKMLSLRYFGQCW